MPSKAQDDLGQMAEAAITFLRYVLEIRLRADPDASSVQRLEITREELTHIKVGDALRSLPFDHRPVWRKSVVQGRRTTPFISTEDRNGETEIKLHQDGQSGRPRPYLASTLPRTVLSSTNALESPTALVARREMRAWRLLQLEPTSLRQSDRFNAPTHVGVDGSHLAATLHHLARLEGNGRSEQETAPIYTRVANQLVALVDDILEVRVDEDRQRELLTLQVLDRDKNLHAARALSEGTLRFLALAVLAMDPEAQGLLCFEEPENGIHPQRISPMLRLLQDLVVDTADAVGYDNPLRQVIVNTHSPSVVSLVEDGDLLVAEPKEMLVGDQRCRVVDFSWLGDTWRHRAKPAVRTVSKGRLGAYLNLAAYADDSEQSGCSPAERFSQRRRVKDREDLQKMLPFASDQ